MTDRNACLFYLVVWKVFSLNSSPAFFQQGARKVWDCICKWTSVINCMGAGIYNIKNVFYKYMFRRYQHLCEIRSAFRLTSKNLFRSSHPEVFLRKGVLKICSKSTGEYPCQSVISIKLLWNFIEITLQYGCSPVNLLHIFRTLFFKNTSGWLLLLPV